MSTTSLPLSPRAIGRIRSKEPPSTMNLDYIVPKALTGQRILSQRLPGQGASQQREEHDSPDSAGPACQPHHPPDCPPRNPWPTRPACAHLRRFPPSTPGCPRQSWLPHQTALHPFWPRTNPVSYTHLTLPTNREV